jgi:hypothetical protein
MEGPTCATCGITFRTVIAGGLAALQSNAPLVRFSQGRIVGVFFLALLTRWTVKRWISWTSWGSMIEAQQMSNGTFGASFSIRVYIFAKFGLPSFVASSFLNVRSRRFPQRETQPRSLVPTTRPRGCELRAQERSGIIELAPHALQNC